MNTVFWGSNNTSARRYAWTPHPALTGLQILDKGSSYHTLYIFFVDVCLQTDLKSTGYTVYLLCKTIDCNLSAHARFQNAAFFPSTWRRSLGRFPNLTLWTLFLYCSIFKHHKRHSCVDRQPKCNQSFAFSQYKRFCVMGPEFKNKVLFTKKGPSHGNCCWRNLLQT